MALSLVESIKLALGRDEIALATVMELYARSADILQVMPFRDIAGGSLIYNSEQTLPAVGFRAVNEAYDEGTGTVNRVTEMLYIAGGDADVDTYHIKTGNADQRGVEESMKIKALGLSLAKTIIKGDTEATPKEFDGLQVRLVGNQLVDAGSSSGGDALSLAKLDELYDTVDEPTHWLMNKTIRRRLSAAARLSSVGGYITFELDAFGRKVTYFNDLPILIADKDNEYNDVLPFTEACSSGTSAGTSVYCLSFAENGVIGLQNGEMSVKDLGEIDDKPVYRTRIEWLVSMAILRARAGARLRYVKDSAVVV